MTHRSGCAAGRRGRWARTRTGRSTTTWASTTSAGCGACWWTARDRMPELLARRRGAGVLRGGQAVRGGVGSGTLGALPNEYLHYYYFNREAVASIRQAATTRGEFLREQQARFYETARTADGGALAAWERTRLERETTYLAASREASGGWERDSCDLDGGGYDRIALAIMRAIARDERTTLILNVGNRTAVPGLDADAVVEVPCLVDAGGARPMATGAVAPDQLGLMLSLKAVERSTIEAAEAVGAVGASDTSVGGAARSAALRALALHPLVDSVNVAGRILDAAGYRR
ncbi:6-phospho-beta-glucosidase [Streptomyces himastatinicus ATCC 53653]|uniref:6-phospho-beta-glucosidase n=1 Tax=Streptomyces himastatinicus ATCC 53653 TaxID=457427 RepID=D9WCJ3_9ACTN|nr:6-phospho-beta-glucosidase [Streptomyces himastatinicus ATCC 53653]